jgi:hypothetical protein
MRIAKCMNKIAQVLSPVTCATIIVVSNAYEATLNGTPKNTSALRWYKLTAQFSIGNT